MKKSGIVFVMIIGSFCVYCAQNTLGGMKPGGGDGMVPPAHGQGGGSCCALPSPTVIFDQEVALIASADGKSCESPVWDISSYADVAIHVDLTSDLCHASGNLIAQQRYGVAGFLEAGYGVLCGGPSDRAISHVNPHDGGQLRLRFNAGGTVDCSRKLRATVVGWK